MEKKKLESIFFSAWLPTVFCLEHDISSTGALKLALNKHGSTCKIWQGKKNRTHVFIQDLGQFIFLSINILCLEPIVPHLLKIKNKKLGLLPNHETNYFSQYQNNISVWPKLVSIFMHNVKAIIVITIGTPPPKISSMPNIFMKYYWNSLLSRVPQKLWISSVYLGCGPRHQNIAVNQMRCTTPLP